MNTPKSTRSKKTGLPPGTLVYVGENNRRESFINYCSFNETKIEQKQVATIEEALIPPPEGEVLWLDIDGIQNVELVEKVGKFFNLHSLVLEDILNTTKRPKYEDFGDYIFLILKVIHPQIKGKKFVTEQVSIILGKNFVLSFQEVDRVDAFGAVRDRLRSGKGRLRKMGPCYLAYALIDSIVDGYFGALEILGENLEQLEHDAVTSADEITLREIHQAKRQTLMFRRAVWPVREIMNGIIREESHLIVRGTLLYLRDVYDHVVEVLDVLEADRDIAASLMEIYLSGLSNRMNSVMKVLTVITTIFMPLTFIAGIYGMNFHYMPELSSTYGYPITLIVMAVVALTMLIFFRKKRWI